MAEYISIDTAFNLFQRFCEDYRTDGPFSDYQDYEFYILLQNEAEDMAPVVHGRWDWETEDIYICSECHNNAHVAERMNVPIYKFCPYCGAKMDKEVTDHAEKN